MEKLAIILLALAIGACSNVGQRPLGNGYSWFSTHGSGGAIIDRDGNVVVAEIVDWTTITVAGHEVFGTRTTDALTDHRPSSPLNESYGPFRLETNTGLVSFGLVPKTAPVDGGSR